MEKNYKAFKILKYFEEYDGERIKINGKTVEFDILFNKYSLPHLLGLHYQYRKDGRSYFNIDNEVMTGKKLYDEVINKKISDQEIYKRIENNNVNKINSVKKRINTFLDFMKNLEKGYIVENIKRKNFGGQVNYFVVEDDKGNYNHLGIKSENGVDVIDGYNKNTDKLITYIIQNHNKYFSRSKIQENIKSIEVYNKEKESYIPFSFNKEGK